MMRPRKIRERYLFFREEWPFQDERILINHHIYWVLVANHVGVDFSQSPEVLFLGFQSADRALMEVACRVVLPTTTNITDAERNPSPRRVFRSKPNSNQSMLSKYQPTCTFAHAKRSSRLYPAGTSLIGLDPSVTPSGFWPSPPGRVSIGS